MVLARNNTSLAGFRPPSELKFQRQLNQARIVNNLRHLAESGGIGKGSRKGKLRVIEDVENLGAENQIRPLANLESFEQRSIEVHKIRPEEWSAGGVAQNSWRRIDEAAGVEPLLHGGMT